MDKMDIASIFKFNIYLHFPYLYSIHSYRFNVSIVLKLAYFIIYRGGAKKTYTSGQFG